MNRSRIRSVLLTTLTLLFGLHVLRVFLPALIWYLGRYLSAEQRIFYALLAFALTLLAPLVRGRLGERGTVALTVAGLALVRMAIQLLHPPLADLVLATAGLGLWGWFLTSWQQSPRNRPGEDDVPALVLAFPLALLLDNGIRSLLWSYDLAWRRDWGATLVVAGLVGLVLTLLWSEWRDHSSTEAAQEPALSRLWPLLGLGPWLYLALAVNHNPAAWVASTGWDDAPVYRLVNLFTGLGVFPYMLAVGWSVRWRWLGALLSGGLLVSALSLLVAGVGPDWLWHGLAALTTWAALGWVLAGTARTGPLRPGLWRSSAVLFVGLATMLAIAVWVTVYSLLWMTPVAGAVLALAATWAARAETRYGSDAVGTGLEWLSTMAVLVLLVVQFLLLQSRAPQIIATLPAGRPLRVMAYNIHQGVSADMRMDLEAIADVIARENPDVVVLNEVNRARVTSGFVDTLPFISRRLGMRYVFGANYRDGQYGNALLSRYPILAWANTHYAHNTTELRGLLRVVIAAPGGPITFYATHLDHLSGPGHARAAQVAEALATWGGEPRAVLLGDLNATAEAPELDPIYEAGFVDVLAAAGQDDAFTFWDPVPGRRIDFIFSTPDLSPGRAWTVPSRASDHLPVLAEVGP